MELFQLRSLIAVAEEGSVTRAAEALCLTQPAVSRHIQALEQEIGVPLFERTERGMRLTPEGVALRDHARRGLALLEEGRRAISELRSGTGGRLTLGAGVTTSIFRLPSLLRAFREAYPRVDVVVRTGRSREIEQSVLDRGLDLGLVTSPVQNPELEVRGLFDEEIVLVIPPELSGSDEWELDAEAFQALPLILFSRNTGFRGDLDRVLAASGLAPEVRMESDSVEAIKSFVTVGLGASFLPASSVEAECRSGALSRARVIGLPPLTRRTSAIYRRDRHLPYAAERFLAILRSHYPCG